MRTLTKKAALGGVDAHPLCKRPTTKIRNLLSAREWTVLKLGALVMGQDRNSEGCPCEDS